MEPNNTKYWCNKIQACVVLSIEKGEFHGFAPDDVDVLKGVGVSDPSSRDEPPPRVEAELGDGPPGAISPESVVVPAGAEDSVQLGVAPYDDFLNAGSGHLFIALLVFVHPRG